MNSFDFIFGTMTQIYRETILPILERDGYPVPVEDNFLRKWWMALDPGIEKLDIKEIINTIADIGSKLLDNYMLAVKAQKPTLIKRNTTNWYQPVTF